jgi:PKD repeat protein
VTVTFSPTSATSYGGTVTVNSDATSGGNTTTASGTGTVTPTYSIVITSAPSEGGVATGGGNYISGSSVTAVATPNSCYNFVNWTEGGTVVNTSASFSFTANANRTFVVNFSQISYTVTTSSLPVAGGTTSGGGITACGSSVTVTAVPGAGYSFVNWTENGNPLSGTASYTFIANGDRNLVANFSTTPPCTYTISTSSLPLGGGTTSGGGTVTCSNSVTVVATPGTGYTYVNWTENGSPVSSSASYTFMASGDRNLVANFTGAPVAPVASFTAGPTNGAAPLLVNFTDASSGTVTGWAWVFGDGGTSTLASPSYSYANAGTFSVSLTVFGPLGSNTLSLANYITVTNLLGAPVTAFNASPMIGAAPLLVNFTDASVGTITNHSWNFGDGNTSVAVNPSHTYSNAGVYSVSLIVLGPSGSSSTNRPNLITVTNAVNILPTVTIVRPGNGMLYPPVTNLTITIVASATANDGGNISKIEFFEGDTKLGETTSNPGTNLLVNPTLGSHVISARTSDTLGATNISVGVTVTVGAKNSPLGDWEVTISGADKGAQFLTFEDDFSASGFGIRLKTFGLEDVSGHWSFNAKGQVTGPFFEETGITTNWSGTLLGTVKSLKSLSGTVPTSAGTFHWKGIPATTFPDLSGDWTGLVTVVKSSTGISYTITNNATDSAVFDIATSDAPGTVVGQLLVTSRNSVYGYVTFEGKPITVSGTFSAARSSLTLKGTDDTAEKVAIKLFKQ